MSKVSYIHGPFAERSRSEGIPQNEMRDRAKGLPARSFVDYSALTDGEMKLILAYEQFRILSAYYPEAREARRSAELLKDALFMGLHGPKNRLSGTDQAQVRRLIEQARARTAPAAFVMDGRASILQGIGDVIDRDTPPIVNDWGRDGNGTGSAIDATLPPMPAFTQKDCGKKPTGPFKNKERREAYDLCAQQNQYVRLLNEKLEKSGHHILYSFNDKPNQSPQVVTVKTVNHRAAIEKWNEITGLSKDNIRNWIRVGIMRNNARVGVEPYQPEQTIAVFKEGVIAKNQKGVGEPLTIAAIVAIISAITAAAGATAALINSLSARDSLRFKSSLGDMGLPSFGPEEGDWLDQLINDLTGGDGTSTGGFDIKQLIIPAALATGAYFLLKED